MPDNKLNLFMSALLASSLFLTGCSDDKKEKAKETVQSGGESGSSSSDLVRTTIRLDGVVTLVSHDEIVTENNTVSGASANLRSGNRTLRSTSNQYSSNLLGLDEDGNLVFPIQSESPIYVNYSVLDPTGQYLYMSVSGSNDWDGEGALINGPRCLPGNSEDDYAYCDEENLNPDAFYCNFLKVDRFEIATPENAISCLGGLLEIPGQLRQGKIHKGNHTSPTAEDFREIRSDLKPLQFDADGNVYVLGTVISSENIDPYSDDTYTGIVRINPETSEAAVITQDDEYIYSFAVLADGEVVYNDSHEDSIKMLQGDSTITVDSTTDRFQMDTGNTMIIGNQLVHPRTAGGFERVALPSNGADFLTLGDDGVMYGTDYSSDYRTNYLMTIMPYDPTPLGELRDGYQISKGYIYTKREVDSINYGKYDVLDIARIGSDEEKTLFFTPTENFANDTVRYDIESFVVAGSTLSFSAKKQPGNDVVIGQINTTLLNQGAPESEYLKFQSVGSAVAADNSVREIVPLPPVQAANDTGGKPKIIDSFLHNENFQQVGFEFSKYMNKSTIDSGMSFTDKDSNAVPYIPFWIYKSLYLIPDLDGFTNTTHELMKAGEDYTISFDSTVLDAYDWQLDTDFPTSFTKSLAPEGAAYVPTDAPTLDDSAEGKADGNLLKLSVGPAISELYQAADSSDASDPLNLRLEFSLYDMSETNSGFGIGWARDALIGVAESRCQTYDFPVCSSTQDDTSSGIYASLDFDGRTIGILEQDGDIHNSVYYSGDTSEEHTLLRPCAIDQSNSYYCTQGIWKRYRVDVFDGTMKVFVQSSTDESDNPVFTEASSLQASIPTTNTAGAIVLYRQGNEALVFDNIKISKLVSDGASSYQVDTTVGTNGVVLDEDFNNGLGAASIVKESKLSKYLMTE